MSVLPLGWCPVNPFLFCEVAVGDSPARHGLPLLIIHRPANTTLSMSLFLSMVSLIVNCTDFDHTIEKMEEKKSQLTLLNIMNEGMIEKLNLILKKWNSDECDIYFIDLFWGEYEYMCTNMYV